MNDKIDAYDSSKLWYVSYIVEKENRKKNGKEVPFLKVAFREFHPEGNRTDDEG